MGCTLPGCTVVPFMFCLFLCLLLVLLGFALLVLLNRLEDVVLFHRDALDPLNPRAFDKDAEAGEDGDETTQRDEHPRAPRRPVEAIEMPHPDTQADLKARIEHVHPHDKVQGP